MKIVIATGPSTSEVTREQAAKQIALHPNFPRTKVARESLSLDAVDGRWVAAFVHDAGMPPPPPQGPPADDDEEAPGPKSEGPDDTAPDPDGPPEGEEGPPKEKKDKGGEGKELHHLLDLVTQIAGALGIAPAGPMDSPVPDDGGMGGPLPGGPDGGLPPGPDDKQHIVHERSLKPGEVPPGGTPLGAPAFSSVDPKHPWSKFVGRLATMDFDEEIGDTPLPQVVAEVEHLAKTSGFKLKQLYEYEGPDGERRARGQVSVY